MSHPTTFAWLEHVFSHFAPPPRPALPSPPPPPVPPTTTGAPS